MNTVHAQHAASGDAARKIPPKILILAAVILLLLALSYFLPVRDWLLQLMELLRAFGPYGLLALSLLYIAACVLMVPGSILSLGAGFLAGAAWPDNFPLALLLGVASVSAGSVAGATAAFLLGRNFARAWIERRVAHNSKFRALDDAIAQNGLKMVLLVRLSPAFPFNVLNYALGLTRLSLRDYVLGSWIGMLPGTVMYVYFGMGVQGVAALTSAGAGEQSAGKIAVQAVGLAATIAVVLLVTRIARRAFNDALANQNSGQETTEPHE